MTHYDPIDDLRKQYSTLISRVAHLESVVQGHAHAVVRHEKELKEKADRVRPVVAEPVKFRCLDHQWSYTKFADLQAHVAQYHPDQAEEE